MVHTRILAVPFVLAAIASAQNPLGTFTNMGATFTTRGNATVANTNPSTVFVRHDKECYSGYTNGVVPFTLDISGVNFVLQDQNLLSQDAFNLVVYTGDPANNDYPLVASPVATTGLITPPLGPAGPAAFNVSIAFATPVSVSSAEDVYVGLQFFAGWLMGTGGAVDGLSVWEIRDAAPPQPQAGQSWDVAGGRQPSAAQTRAYGGYYCPSPQTGPAYPVPSQYFIQPLVPISGGVAATLTNQTNHVESTAGATAGFLVDEPGAGTSCMFSGLYPDASVPARTPGRVDEICQMFLNPSLNAGSPVFYLMDFGPLPVVGIQVASFVPGSTGVSCLNFGSQVALGFGFLSPAGRAFRLASFPATARTLLIGLEWAQQAVALDTGTNTLHATACTIQRT